MKWVLIGASDIASTRVVPALRLAGHEVYGVMSSNSGRAADYATRNSIIHHTDSLEVALSWPVDAVYISTTNELHFSQASAAAKAKKHILCEKPIAMSVADAHSMLAAAKENGVTFATNHHIRTSGVHQKIHEIIASGKLGTVYLARINHAVALPERLQGWRLDSPEKGAGVVLDIVVHNVDTLRAAIGGNITEVTALISSNGLGKGNVEDTSSCIFRFDNGVLASTVECFLVPFNTTTFEVHGSRGSLVATGVMSQDPIGEITLTDGAGVHTIEVSDRENLYVKTIRQFEQAVTGNGAPLASGDDGFASMQAALAVLQSAREKRTISITELADNG
jgi:1,5-anhydro-D-fructose reductase (1,5-anhydro-D-mannitol-forming)